MNSGRTVLVPAARVRRWFENFETRHGAATLAAADGALAATAADGASAVARLPLGRAYDGPPDVTVFTAAAEPRGDWGLLLVRKGGFAVARLTDAEVVASKVGQRHVQGRTKAGGQSQQRFARRRANQARLAYEAAAEHAQRVLVGEAPPLAALVCGGDRAAVDQVLAEPRLSHLAELRTDQWLPVPDPRRAVLDQAVLDALSVAVIVHEPAGS